MAPESRRGFFIENGVIPFADLKLGWSFSSRIKVMAAIQARFICHRENGFGVFLRFQSFRRGWDVSSQFTTGGIRRRAGLPRWRVVRFRFDSAGMVRGI
jgi:hypothetical protein